MVITISFDKNSISFGNYILCSVNLIKIGFSKIAIKTDKQNKQKKVTDYLDRNQVFIKQILMKNVKLWKADLGENETVHIIRSI